jgi:hypothetical protein
MSMLRRALAACRRLDRRADLWITVGVLLGFLIFDSIPIAAAIGVGIWLAMPTGSKRPGPT